jgi:hypothetical protein
LLSFGKIRSVRSAVKLSAEILNVNVGPETNVVCEIPSVVIGIFVDDNVVAVPEPAVAVADVKGRDVEIETAEPEAIGAAAGEMPDVAGAEAAGEVAVLPGMIEVIVNVVASGVVADPFAVGVNVRRVGMAGMIVEMLRRGVRRARRRRTVLGNVAYAGMLREGGDG